MIETLIPNEGERVNFYKIIKLKYAEYMTYKYDYKERKVKDLPELKFESEAK